MHSVQTSAGAFYRRAEELKSETVAIRRDLHRYPEGGFLEYRTASKVVATLRDLGFTVYFGADANDTSETVALPSGEVQDFCMRRAVEEGADPETVSAMRDGRTGVVGVLDGTAGGGGPTVAFRFDMDANDVPECDGRSHRPTREGFASRHEGVMHACGHDGHVAIGLTLAKLLSESRDSFGGRVKLIFQPAEEGVRGALPMLRAGAIEDVDVFFGGHVGLSARENGTLVASVGEFFAASKFDVSFLGRSSHAGFAPEEGRNALLAAANAALALHALPRHGRGTSRVNVGVLHAGTSRNVIPHSAEMAFETRGVTSEINNFMESEARRIVRASAEMYGCSSTVRRVGYADAFEPDAAFADEIAQAARESGLFTSVAEYGAMNASEDCTSFLASVTARGGVGTYMLYGTELAAVHHNASFDFDEDVLPRSAAWLATLAVKYASGDRNTGGGKEG